MLFQLMVVNVPDKIEKGIDTLKHPLFPLPGVLSDVVVEHLYQCIQYEPVIGFMGKAGVGKSSLCYSLFTPYPVRGRTRRLQQYAICLGPRTFNLIDFPGFSVNTRWDDLYQSVYCQWSERLDLIIWVLNPDDRDWHDDVRCYQQLISDGAHPNQFLFVLNQVDRIAPSQEWDTGIHQPSLRQQQNLQEKVDQINTVFSPVHPVLAMSVVEGFNIPQWVETLVMSLPDKPRHRVIRPLNENVSRTTKENLVRLVSDIVVDVVEALLASHTIKKGLARIRDRLLSLMTFLWYRFA